MARPTTTLRDLAQLREHLAQRFPHADGCNPEIACTCAAQPIAALGPLVAQLGREVQALEAAASAAGNLPALVEKMRDRQRAFFRHGGRDAVDSHGPSRQADAQRAEKAVDDAIRSLRNPGLF